MSWTAMLVGWRGIGSRKDLVTINDVREFALSSMNESHPIAPCAVALLDAPHMDPSEVESCLAELSTADPVDRDAAVRMWIACLLDGCLAELPDDSVYGLLRITEFWSDLRFPESMPFQPQGRGNDLSPQDYYTDANYRQVVMRHRQWLEHETRRLGGHRT